MILCVLVRLSPSSEPVIVVDDQSQCFGVHCQVQPAFKSGFFHDVLDVPFHCIGRNVQPFGNLLVG